MATKPHLLTKLVVGEVSGVDRGAGEGVTIVLMKRLDGESIYAPIEKSRLSQDAIAYVSKEFSAEDRAAMVKTGHAMPDGGFPIGNADDLEKAIASIDAAKNPKAAKTHIISRAKALGAAEKIPEMWTQTQPTKKSLIDGLIAIAKAATSAGASMPMVNRAQNALWKVIDSTATGDGVGNDDLHKAFDECAAYLGGHVPSSGADAFAAASVIAISKIFGNGDEDAMPMTPAELEAAITKAVTAATAPLTANIAKLEFDLAVSKMSPKAKTYFDKMADGDVKKAFPLKKPADQDAEAEAADKAAIEKTALPPEVKELVLKTESIAAENVDLRKRLDAAESITKADDFKKRAVALGLAEADGEIMRKAYSGDAEAQKKLDEKILALSKQVNPRLFAEIGKAGEAKTGGTYDQLVAKADELRKTDAGKALTKEQAFSKVYEDPANKELVAAYKAEDMAKRMGRAA